MNLSTLMAQLAGLWTVTPEALSSFVEGLRQMFSGSVPEARIAAKSKSTTPAYEMEGPVAIIPVKGTLAKNGLECFGFQLLTSMRDIRLAVL